jgi:hypothetical protein
MRQDPANGIVYLRKGWGCSTKLTLKGENVILEGFLNSSLSRWRHKLVTYWSDFNIKRVDVTNPALSQKFQRGRPLPY